MEEEISVEVRAVDGSSTVVHIAPERTVGDLQAMLKESFPPAKEFSHFHLFYKGAQLRTENSIRSHPFNQGEFVVMVPFSKRTRKFQQSQSLPDGSAEPSKRCNNVEILGHADSAWTDIMEDLTSFSNAPTGSPIDKVVPEENTCPEKQNAGENRSMSTKSNRTESCFLFLRDFLRNSRHVLESLHREENSSPETGLSDCLSNPDSGQCYYSEEFYRSSVECDRCTCPVWLRRLVKCFSFLNAAHSFLSIQQRCIEWQCLRQALERPGVCQIKDISISDVENLMFLCPKMVLIGNKKTFLSRYMEAIVILDCTDILDMQPMPKTRNRTRSSHASSIFARQKRENALKDALLTMIRSALGMTPSGSMFPFSLSLEDLISLKGTCDFSEGSTARVVKNRPPVSENHAECLCQATTSLQPLEMVEHLQRGLGIHGQIVHVEEFPAKAAVYANIPGDLSEGTSEALREMGISRLYSHQADAICASLSGKNIVVATSTSSGKSLCYNIPVFEELCRNPLSCALYLFPTKALAQDQLRALLEMTRGLGETLDVAVYDGDTPQDDRAFIQNNARLLITNPDMLHVSILPFHGQFKRILSNLRFVVIDEAHTYKGAFGCHTSFIIRRLCRICSHVYGREPSFIFCTATSANPREHAMELGNLEDLELISNDGSPCGPKLFLLWNPPLHNAPKILGNKDRFSEEETSGRRSSPIYEVSCLLAEMVQHGLRCIAFCKSRKLCELILCYTRQILGEIASDLVNSISVYRAGYTAQDRRCIENDLFGGKLRGIAATNALELGIDVGHIDATLHLGFPGTFASFWQQAGRCGRRQQPSLSIYVAFEGPLDQYFMKYPKKLFGNPIEHCQVDTNNSQVLEQHVTCAALEHPLCVRADETYFGSGLRNATVTLRNQGYLSYNSSCDVWNYIGPEKRPSLKMSIRAIETEKYAVVDTLSNKVLEEIEESKAFFQVYDGAVYIHQGTTYLVKTLDLSKKVAFCQKADLKYYTKVRDYTDVHVYGGDLAYPQSARSTPLSRRCRVTTRWFGFHRIRRGSNQIFDTVNLSLPPYSYETTAVWIEIPRPIRISLEARGLWFRGGQHAASHALLNVAPLHVMSNVSDLSAECPNPHEKRDLPERLLLYDQHPGGMGLSARLRPLFMELLRDALRLVASCGCSAGVGCPACVQNVSCREYNHLLDKAAAISILEGILTEPE